MRVLFIAAELAPLAKVGGLGDVAGSLPKALRHLGHDVRVMMPGYGLIDLSGYSPLPVLDNLSVKLAKAEKPVFLKSIELDSGVVVYLVSTEMFCKSYEVYGEDDLTRFLFFCRAVVEILKNLDWQPDIVHCHDWHTALIPLWLRKGKCECATVFTIHNLAYQGTFDRRFLSRFGLKEDWQSWPASAEKPPLNFMSQGILWSDILTTVSETYAGEILTPEYGMGLDALLRFRQKELFGIINGLDYDKYNPASDSFLAANYDSSTLTKKALNKLALQRKVGLQENEKVPLIGMVSRLDEQKGFDILLDTFDSMLQRTSAQLVILGRGKEYYQAKLVYVAERYPQRVAILLTFDEALAQLVYGGCDIFLMPSRFEPCGLGQLMAYRYGTVPIVRHTGGLADTVQDLADDLKRGTGFVFTEYSPESLLAAVVRATRAFESGEAWSRVVQRIMALDFSWRYSAEKYVSVYTKAIDARGNEAS
ncbi:MAG: glycogen synthase GlgA [Chloroflexi bacterium]|nr:glycogen synthase GlgA [Chloroflexota bacterium]MBM3173421.1 glycogen synthase GlgA [Chloroflexota bacterium]MBM4450188.1 glycogen synthase GlgA [Chloroflexota bacterium]